MGSSMPGVPLVIVGRTKDISWGVTSANTDISDIFEEKINEEKDTYLVDGEERKLKTVVYDLKIKG